MVFIALDPTKPAQVCKLEYDPTTGEGHVLLSDELEVTKRTRIQCTTLEEYTILQSLGYNVHLNEHPSDATMNGVPVAPEETKVEGVPPMTPPI